MLASLLPGLRDLRTPLATGYLWLTALWLLLHDRLPKNVDEARGPFRSFYEAGVLVGNTACLAALSFVAYLLGSILLLRVGRNDSAYIVPGKDYVDFEPALRSPLPGMVMRIVNARMGASMYDQLRTVVSRRLRQHGRDLDSDVHMSVLPYAILRRSEKPPILEDRRAVPELYVRAVIADLPAVGVQLQAKNQSFWDTYDRQKAEAQFRIGIALPISLIVILLAVQSGQYLWLLLLIVPLILLVLAMRLEATANSALVQAVVLRMVEPPVLERLTEVLAEKKAEEAREQERLTAEIDLQEHARELMRSARVEPDEEV
jgi:hypothetical protein